MGTPEANFWNTLKKNLPKKLYATRIENRHGGGVPDVDCIWSGISFWMELKTTKNNAVNLSPNQIAWNTAYSGSGGLSFILVKHLSSGDLFLFEGFRVRELRVSGLKTKSLVRGSGYKELWETIRGAGIEHLSKVLVNLQQDQDLE